MTTCFLNTISRGKKGMRGKYYLGPNQEHEVRIYHADGTITKRRYGSLQKVILLDSDVAAHFPDSESVNHALRTLIALVPDNRIAEKKAKYRTSKTSAKKSAASR